MSGKKITKVDASAIKNVPFLDFKREYKEIKSEVNLAIKRVLASGWFILGEELKAFEKEFGEYLGVKHCIGINSGTDALFLSLMAIGIKKGDEVITVSNTFISAGLAIASLGAKLVFVDIDEKSYNIDPKKIEDKITSKTKAILPVHLYGYPCEMDKINFLAKKYNLKVVEDACQAHGSSFGDKKLGTLSDIGCFSFYPTKNLGGYGDGGALVTNNDELARKIYLLRNYGEVKKYFYQIRGVNTRLDEIQAAVLRVKLKHLDQGNERRKKIADIYFRRLSNLPMELPPKDSDKNVGNFYVFVVRIKQREKFQEYLSEKGIKTLIHYPVPIHLQESFAQEVKQGKELMITEKVCREIVSLPIFPQMKKEEVNYICDSIRGFFK